MAAGTWKLFGKAKKYLANNTIVLSGGIFKMMLCRASASAKLLLLSTVSTWASIPGEISARGGYAANGRSIPGGGKWTAGASAKQWKFSFTTGGLSFTASGSALNNIKYAVIRNSTGTGAGKVLCYCTLSTAAFTIASPNILTVLPATTGVFTLA